MGPWFRPLESQRRPPELPWPRQLGPSVVRMANCVLESSIRAKSKICLGISPAENICSENVYLVSPDLSFGTKQFRSILVQELSRVYAQYLMRSKLLIAILVLALAGVNSGAATLCAAYCMSAATVGSAVAHHHQMESQPGPTSIGHHIHGLHHSANCAECANNSRNSLHQKADCASWVQIQALKEGTFSLDAPSGVPQFDAADTPAYAIAIAHDGEHSLVLGASRTIRSSSSASVPLRI